MTAVLQEDRGPGYGPGMDVPQFLAITGPIGTALYAAARFLGPRMVDAWERAQREKLDVEARKATALESVATGQGLVLAELKLMNERMGAVEQVVVDKRFSDMGKKLEKILRQQTNPNLQAVEPDSDPPPPLDDHAHDASPAAPTAITLTIGVAQAGAAAQQSAVPSRAPSRP